jgi:hypothetical protein
MFIQHYSTVYYKLINPAKVIYQDQDFNKDIKITKNALMLTKYPKHYAGSMIKTLWGGGIDGSCGYLPHIVISSLCGLSFATDHYCLTNCTEDKGFRVGDATSGYERLAWSPKRLWYQHQVLLVLSVEGDPPAKLPRELLRRRLLKQGRQSLKLDLRSLEL